VITADLVPLRPDRRKPRAVKRRRQKYPLLNRPRHDYRQIRRGSYFPRSVKRQRHSD
jgi:hypothetical protein